MAKNEKIGSVEKTMIDEKNDEDAENLKVDEICEQGPLASVNTNMDEYDPDIHEIMTPQVEEKADELWTPFSRDRNSNSSSEALMLGVNACLTKLLEKKPESSLSTVKVLTPFSMERNSSSEAKMDSVKQLKEKTESSFSTCKLLNPVSREGKSNSASDAKVYGVNATVKKQLQKKTESGSSIFKVVNVYSIKRKSNNSTEAKVFKGNESLKKLVEKKARNSSCNVAVSSTISRKINISTPISPSKTFLSRSLTTPTYITVTTTPIAASNTHLTFSNTSSISPAVSIITSNSPVASTSFARIFPKPSSVVPGQRFVTPIVSTSLNQAIPNTSGAVLPRYGFVNLTPVASTSGVPYSSTISNCTRYRIIAPAPVPSSGLPFNSISSIFPQYRLVTSTLPVASTSSSIRTVFPRYSVVTSTFPVASTSSGQIFPNIGSVPIVNSNTIVPTTSYCRTFQTVSSIAPAVSKAPLSNLRTRTKRLRRLLPSKPTGEIECIDLTDSPDEDVKSFTYPSSMATFSLHPAPVPPATIYPPNGNLLNVPPQPIVTMEFAEVGIVLHWDMPPNYSMYAKSKYFEIIFYKEKKNMVVNSNLWNKLVSVHALNPPMQWTITQLDEGHTYHIAIRAVDVHGRCGPYSKPLTFVYKVRIKKERM